MATSPRHHPEWENGQDFIDVVSEVIPGHDAPDEAPDRLQRFQKDTGNDEKGWWHPPMPAIRPGFQERPRTRVNGPVVPAPTTTTTSAEAALPAISTTRLRLYFPVIVQTEPSPKRHKKGRGTFNVV